MTVTERRPALNLVFRLPAPEQEKKLAQSAWQQAMVGLKGCRSVGGVRASSYNAVPLAGVETRVEFMDDFHKGS